MYNDAGYFKTMIYNKLGPSFENHDTRPRQSLEKQTNVLSYWFKSKENV